MIFRLGAVDHAAIVTADHGNDVVSLTAWPPGTPQMCRNHVTQARLPNQENTWRERT